MTCVACSITTHVPGDAQVVQNSGLHGRFQGGNSLKHIKMHFLKTYNNNYASSCE